MKYCEEYAALLDPFVDGELEPEEMARVQTHLAECPGCRAYVDDALAMRAGFPDVEETAVPEGFTEGVMKRVREESGKNQKTIAFPRRRSFRRWAGFGALAACCALVILVRTGLGGGYGAAMVASSGASEECAMDTGAPAGGGEDGGVSPQIAAAPSEAPAAAGGAEAPTETERADVPEAAAERKQTEYSMEDWMAAPEEADGGAVEGAAAVPADAAPANVAGRLYLTASEAGDLLENFDPAWENAAERGYELTGEEYRELLKALGRTEELPETAEGPFIIVVTGPFE